MAGDIILEFDGHEVKNIRDYSYYSHLKLGADVPLLFTRDGAENTTSLVPRWDPPEGQGATGATLEMVNITTVSEWYQFWEAIPKAGTQSWETMVLFKNEVERLIIAKEAPEVAGPVGIAQLTGEVAEGGVGLLLQFAAFLSINLAIVNLLPIPALDGGRIVFVALEGIRRGKKVSPKREAMIHLIGFAVIISIMVAVAFQDIVRIIRGESLVP
jgi:regulator of sigma E protease